MMIRELQHLESVDLLLTKSLVLRKRISSPMIGLCPDLGTMLLLKSKLLTKQLTRKKLKQGEDWEEWKLAEWQHLDMYYNKKCLVN